MSTTIRQQKAEQCQTSRKREIQKDSARHKLALQCTWDIEGIAGAVRTLADEVGADGDIAHEALLRCYGMRIAALNSQVMAYLDNDLGVTAERMHAAIFGRFKSADEVTA